MRGKDPERVRRNRLLTYVAAVLCAALALGTASVSAAKPVPFRPYRINGQPIRAVTITDIRQFSVRSVPDLKRLKADGANMVTIYPFRFLATYHATSQYAGPLTEPDALIGKTIDLAHQAGLQVQLIPTIWVGPGYGAFYWRGAIKPDNTHAFFDSYRTMVNHYADLATQHHVELYGVGSEMLSLEGLASEWKQTIGEARQHFKGPLTYFTIYSAVEHLSWWNLIDYPGLSPYMSLASAAVPSYAQIAQGWTSTQLPALRRISAYVGRPLLVSEIGYASVAGAATHPENSPSGAVQEGLQRDLYQAFFELVLKDRSVDGVSFYRWSLLQSGSTDAGFSPKGKPAECVLVRHWAPTGANAATCAAKGRIT